VETSRQESGSGQPSFWVDVVGGALIAVAVTVVLAKNARPGRSGLA
jgi:hypothetical protein